MFRLSSQKDKESEGRWLDDDDNGQRGYMHVLKTYEGEVDDALDLHAYDDER